MALADELRAEIERIERQIERLQAERDALQAERDALRRVLARTGAKPALADGQPPTDGVHPPDRPVPLREAIVACVAEAGPPGIRMAQIIERLQATLPWMAGSIRTTAAKLYAEGYLSRDGHQWKPGAPLPGAPL